MTKAAIAMRVGLDVSQVRRLATRFSVRERPADIE